MLRFARPSPDHADRVARSASRLPRRVRVAGRRGAAPPGSASARPTATDTASARGVWPAASGGKRALLAISGALLAVATPAPAQINNCIPPSGRGAAVGALDDLRGSILLVAYATSGAKQGKIASGTVDLVAAPANVRAAGVQMIGSTTIDLARVGGEFAGSLRSRDPGAPSVTLEGARGGAPPTLTFGSVRTRGANGEPAVPVVRFDILERYRKGVRGRWRTVGGSARAGSGYFCASRF